MNYGGNLHNTLENLMMMSAAEDQDIVLEQIANKDNRILDHQFFVPGGGPHPLSREDMILVVGQEYRPPFWGHVFMFGLRDHLISPFTTGYEGTAIESLYPSNTDMFRKAKAQGAYVGYVHAYAGERDPLEADLGGAKGAVVDAALGTTDAIEWSAASRAGFAPMYALWNNGLKVTAVGGEDSISNLHMSKLVGSQRTYVFTGERGLNMQAWLDGMRSGRAFVTNGPMVELSVNGSLPGETVNIAAGGGGVEVHAQVRFDRAAAESDVVLQRSTGRGHPALDRSEKRGPSKDVEGREKRVVSRAGRRRARRSVSARYRVSARFHEPCLGHRRRSTRPRSCSGRLRVALD